MSTLQVDRIIPYQSSSVTVEGLSAPNLATTGSNTFTGNQNIQGTITASIAQGFALVGGVGNVSTLVATSSFGTQGNFATTGSNTFVGDQTITGAVTISGSTEFDLTVQGRQLITGPTTGQTPQLLISSSDFNNRIGRSSVIIAGTNNATASLVPQSLSITTGTNNAGAIQLSGTANSQYFGQSFGGNVGTLNVSDLTEIGFALDGAQWTTNWANGPIIYVNNTPGDTYEGVFGFQDKTNYTDGRVSVLKPMEVTGSVSLSSTLKLAQQNPLPTGGVGQLAVSASNLYYHNGSTWTQIN